MSNRYASIHVRKMRGKLKVMGFGSTPRGTKFIRDMEELEVTDIHDKKFKAELAAAVAKLMSEN